MTGAFEKPKITADRSTAGATIRGRMTEIPIVPLLRALGLSAALLILPACAGSPKPQTTAASPTTTPETIVEAPTPEPVPPAEPATQLDTRADPPTDTPTEAVAPIEEPAAPAVQQKAAEPLDPEGVLEESLEIYESAIQMWQRGELDQAYELLDNAYELMASVPTDGDALIAQQKEDLRQLIAERVLQIHASQLSAVGDLNAEIPMVINEYVQREIESFQGPERQSFMEAYERSGLYRPMITKKLRAAGMPDSISWLPMVESWYKVRAYSRARALGMWQFIPSTGYRYDMSRDWWIDERMDPEKSTDAAIAYLTDLHRLFGDWMTAMAGYNCGEGAVKRAITRQSEDYHDQFWDIYTRLPRETRRYVPRFLATLAIVNDPEQYGFDLPAPLPKEEYSRVEIGRSVELGSIDSMLGLTDGTLANHNPELRRKATPDGAYSLKVPTAHAEGLTVRLAEVPEWVAPVSITTTYRIRRGDTLSGIASRHGTSVSTLMDLNNLRSANRIRQGQTLIVPDSRPSQRFVLAAGSEVTYQVRTGDSLWSLAKRYGTTVDSIRKANGLNGNTLSVGQKLVIKGQGGTAYMVQRGDTLGKIAQRQGVSLQRLLSANGLSSRSTIFPGQRLVIPR